MPKVRFFRQNHPPFQRRTTCHRPVIGAVLFCGILLGLPACVKPKEFPDTPYLEYRSASISGLINHTGDTVPVLDLTFYFQDGDGDIGRDDDEPVLFFALREKVSDSLYEPVYAVNDTGGRFAIEYAYMLKPIEAVTANGAVYGTMTWRMEEFGDVAREFQGHIIRFDIWLFDRQGRKSNIIHSEDFRI